MNNVFIWWNLPLQIKEKLNITLLYNWFRIPTCYAEEFEPLYKVNWFTLLTDLQKIYNIVNCTE